jgi:hypothetical protein
LHRAKPHFHSLQLDLVANLPPFVEIVDEPFRRCGCGHAIEQLSVSDDEDADYVESW